MFDVARYLDYQQILYWESGLDREISYAVEILPFVDLKRLLEFNELQLLDGAKETRAAKATSYVGFIEHDTGASLLCRLRIKITEFATPFTAVFNSSAIDAGSLPPQYQLSWTGATIRDQPGC
ncbi:hypothetical protein PQX77_006305 [Marasmius sp. AFHP31]|nr:hypothetical protein PQX77_006305 [Marasmius sp. AFHP31]